MPVPVDTALKLRQTTEYGRLRSAIWGPITATEFDLDDSLATMDPAVVADLKEHNAISAFDTERAAEQHREYRRVLVAEGVEIHEVDLLGEGFSQFGTRDAGFVIDDVFVVARLNTPLRRRETVGLRRLLRRMPQVAWLDTGFIEGGDVMLHDNAVLVGLGSASDEEGIDALRFALETHGVERDVVPVRFSNRGVVHLDTRLMIVDEGLAVLHRETFADESLRMLERTLDLIPVTLEEARAVQVNMIPLGDKRVILAKGSDRLAEELSRRGLRPIEVDYSEVTKVGGSFRCTALPLWRD